MNNSGCIEDMRLNMVMFGWDVIMDQFGSLIMCAVSVSQCCVFLDSCLRARREMGRLDKIRCRKQGSCCGTGKDAGLGCVRATE